VLAARLGVTLDRRGRLYFLGPSRSDSRGVLVRRVRRLSQTELREAISTHIGQDGRLSAFSDGLIVLCDRVQVLERVADMLDQVEAASSPVWCIQLHILSLSENDVKELGLSSTPTLDLAATFAAAAGTSALANNANVRAGLATALKVASDCSSSSVVGQPLFFVSDGGSCTFERVRSYPIANTVYNTQGTGSGTSYSYKDIGLKVGVSLRERSTRSALVQVACELSDIDGYVGEVPISVKEDYQTGAVMESGGIYLLGSLERKEKQHTGWSWLYWGARQAAARQTLYVWATVKAVQGGVIGNSLPPAPAARYEAAGRAELVAPLPPIQ